MCRAAVASVASSLERAFVDSRHRCPIVGPPEIPLAGSGDVKGALQNKAGRQHIRGRSWGKDISSLRRTRPEDSQRLGEKDQ